MVEVALISYMPNPEVSIAVAARSSVSQLSVRKLWHRLSSQEVNDLFRQLFVMEHLSPGDDYEYSESPPGFSSEVMPASSIGDYRSV